MGWKSGREGLFKCSFSRPLFYSSEPPERAVPWQDDKYPASCTVSCAHGKGYQCHSNQPCTLAQGAHSGSRTGVLIRPVRAVLHTVPAEGPRDAATILEDSGGAAPPPRATGRACGHWGYKSQQRSPGIPCTPGHSLASKPAIAPHSSLHLTWLTVFLISLHNRDSRLPSSYAA